MADDCEISQENTDRWLAGAIAYAAAAKPEDVFVPNGYCRWCKDPVDPGVSFCPCQPGETGCRDDWERHEAKKRRAGVI